MLKLHITVTVDGDEVRDVKVESQKMRCPICGEDGHLETLEDNEGGKADHEAERTN